jgi:hypothetical protein
MVKYIHVNDIKLSDKSTNNLNNELERFVLAGDRQLKISLFYCEKMNIFE